MYTPRDPPTRRGWELPVTRKSRRKPLESLKTDSEFPAGSRPLGGRAAGMCFARVRRPHALQLEAHARLRRGRAAGLAALFRFNGRGAVQSFAATAFVSV
jgi:hypothetical protein